MTDYSDAIGKSIGDEGNDGKCAELSLWSFDSVVAATEGFSSSNFIGEGGFGPVYKVNDFSKHQLSLLLSLNLVLGEGSC